MSNLELWERSYRNATRKFHIPSDEVVDMRGMSNKDVIQEIYCSAFEKLDQYDPSRGTFDQWMYGFRLNEERKLRRLANVAEEAIDDYLYCQENGGELPFFSEEVLAFVVLVFDSLENITEKQRKAFILHAQGLTFEQIGTYIGTSRQRAKVLCTKCAAKVNEYLKGDNEIFSI